MTPASILEAPVREQLRAAPLRPRAQYWVRQVLLGLAAIFYAVHFLHLRADFPNHSPWMDWAKYTDEGWYGDGAIRHYLWGHWHIPGDFNPAAALPVWPLIELLVFRFTGVSLVAARVLTVVIFGLILLASYQLLRRSERSSVRSGTVAQPGSFAPELAVLLLATSPFCFAFTRIAIMEPLLVLLTLCALVLAQRAGEAAISPTEKPSRNLNAIALGAILPVIILTKTTGLFLFPAILFMLWAAADQKTLPFLRTSSMAAGIGAVLWLGYFGLFVRPQYLADYRYLFSANTYTKITLSTFWSVLHDTLIDGTWIGDTLFWSSLIALVAWLAVGVASRFRRARLPVALALWVLGYAAFLAYHANFAPRYYMVIAVPLVLLFALAVDVVARLALTNPGHRAAVWVLRLTAAGSTITLLFILLSGARQTLRYAVHPQYTFVTAVHRVNDAVQRELAVNPRHSRLVLSISGSDISLITGLRSICDDFGTMELPDRVATYKPGWFAAWNDVEDDKMAALAPMYRLVKVGSYPAYDDPERNLLVLYRLDPVNSPRRGRSGRRKYFVSPHQRRRKPVATPGAGILR